MNILMLGRWVGAPRYPLKATREYHFGRVLAQKHSLTLAFTTDNPNAVGPISSLRSEFGDLEFTVVPRTWKSLASAVSREPALIVLAAACLARFIWLAE